MIKQILLAIFALIAFTLLEAYIFTLLETHTLESTSTGQLKQQQKYYYVPQGQMVFIKPCKSNPSEPCLVSEHCEVNVSCPVLIDGK